MKAYKIEILVIDHENIGEENIIDTLNNVRYINAHVKSVKSADIGDWDDDHPLNNRKTADKEYERLFQSQGDVALDEELISIDHPEIQAYPETFPEESFQATKLEKPPVFGIPPVYATIIDGSGGWNSAIFVWNCDGEFGFYEPQNTGFNNTLGTGARNDAITEAINWANSEGIPYWIPEEKKDE